MNDYSVDSFCDSSSTIESLTNNNEAIAFDNSPSQAHNVSVYTWTVPTKESISKQILYKRRRSLLIDFI